MDKRTEFWNNEYMKYWEKKVEEASETGREGITKGDVKTPGDGVIQLFFDALPLSDGGGLLDYGCGFGRFYEYFRQRNQDYHGIDISQSMIDEALRRYPELQGKLEVCEGEHLPYEDETFDAIICFGVFDACYQNQALSEMLRVTKLGGLIFITGKNDDYFDDDKLALIAERNARRKGCPNSFTDVRTMRQMLVDFGMAIADEGYALRRGDMGEHKDVASMPENFYEWHMTIRKEKTYDAANGLPVFSDAYSKTWKRVGMKP